MGYRGAVLDLDGTVYRGETPIPGARTALETLRERGLSLRFCSNNPTRTPREFVDRLAGMGIDADATEIVTSGTVTTAALETDYPEAELFVVGAPGFREQIEAAGLSITEEPLSADVVVASCDRGFDYDRMKEALWALDSGAAFLGSDPDPTIPTEDRPVPGSGAIVRAIAGVADREPDRVFGKPSAETAEAVLETLDAAPEECLLVGDRLDTDIEMGERCGMTTVLVQTGATGPEDLEHTAHGTKPDHVLDSIAELGSVLDRGGD